MAPSKPSISKAQIAQATLSEAPLGDYFFISGIESSQVYDERAQAASMMAPMDATIDEDIALETNSRPNSGAGLPQIDVTDHRWSRQSWEARKSIGSVINTAEQSKGSASNRSSVTIKAPNQGDSSIGDFDFDSALRKFATERDNFQEELQFNAGAIAQNNRPRARPKTQRIVPEDQNLKSGVGSIRRRLSTMSKINRHSSVVNRNSSIRTSKRLSGYNAVIPAPQPFFTTPNMHPLKRQYEPVLLDRYPPKGLVEEGKKRKPFPDYVPMFAFPNDVSVVSSDERPRSTWHGFAMTAGDNSKLYGICLTVWVPLNPTAAAELENQCEAWRKANMSPEERELAGSLGERLAAERAKLSELLAQLPTVLSGSDEREQLEEMIGAVEEKIGLMTDLLKPVRHAASSKIEGLTDGETGLWIPRAYGVLGRDGSLTSFWKEWLKAVVVPMTNGAILRVPPSSPRIGMWQPLERYVVNLCAEALSPTTSITQVELAVRELRMYARNEAANEIPGSRNTDLYALFRCLSIPNIVTLFEYAMSEARIIFLSSFTGMLHLASAALTDLLYPFKWSGVFIPVLPARLIQALDAPCPYIVGVERRYQPDEWPDDDFLLVDLDSNLMESNAPPPMQLPRQQRRKLTSLLQVAAPHQNRYGVPCGPPAYAQEAFPYDSFCSENRAIFSPNAPPSLLAQYVRMNSTSFGDTASLGGIRPPVFNAFLEARSDGSGHNRSDSARPSTASTYKTNSPDSPSLSPSSTAFPPLPGTPISRSDSGYSLQANLREKRSGHFNDGHSRRSNSFGVERAPNLRRPSQPFVPGHSSTLSTSTLSSELRAPSSYAPSVYAQSTLAASTIMPGVMMQPVRNSETTFWSEGHCLNWRPKEVASCSVCDEKSEEGMYRCTGCGMVAHNRCSNLICLVCPIAFRADQVRAAFVRCFASLLYTYRRFLMPATPEQKKNGMLFRFNMDGFMRSLPHDQAAYVHMLQQTQAFNEFIHERESTKPDQPSIKLFDQIVLSKRNRGRSSFFSKNNTDFLTDTSEHLWRTASATPPNARFPGDYRAIISRVPAKLDPALMKEPRVLQGVPRPPHGKARRKPIPSMFSASLGSSPPA